MFTDLQRKSPPRSAARRVRHLRLEPLESRLLLAFDVGFGDAVGYPVGENPEALTVADVDDDGVLDLVAPRAPSSAFRNEPAPRAIGVRS